ncbi:MAG: cytochrome c nitrite reductase small subunit [Candidatus Sumerlaeaceae bacterium]
MTSWQQQLLRVGVAASIFVGLSVGLGAYVFWYARGASYLTNDPAACANCHVMQENYAAYLKSSHRLVATCNDCHTPHNLVGKYAVKALNGFRHATAFTTQNFHEPIQITDINRRVTENACRYCHADIVQQIDLHPGVSAAQSQRLSCISCHSSVGHMELSQ